jgi:hypothetical protein
MSIVSREKKTNSSEIFCHTAIFKTRRLFGSNAMWHNALPVQRTKIGGGIGLILLYSWKMRYKMSKIRYFIQCILGLRHYTLFSGIFPPRPPGRNLDNPFECGLNFLIWRRARGLTQAFWRVFQTLDLTWSHITFELRGVIVFHRNVCHEESHKSADLSIRNR